MWSGEHASLGERSLGELPRQVALSNLVFDIDRARFLVVTREGINVAIGALGLPHDPHSDAIVVEVVPADQFAGGVPRVEPTDADRAHLILEKLLVLLRYVDFG